MSEAEQDRTEESCGVPRRYFPQQTCERPRGHDGDHEDSTHLWENARTSRPDVEPERAVMSTETRPLEVAGVSVKYDPSLTVDGTPRWGAQTGPTEVTLRRWDERVFLHEVLHIFLGRHIPSGAHGFSEWIENPAHEKAVREIEDGLWDMGWRLFDGESHIDPTKPRIPAALHSDPSEATAALDRTGAGE